jgi:hypothetical protein
MVFISYSWTDADYVRVLELGLKESGVKLWIDYQRIIPNLPIEPQIDDGIGCSKLVVFVDSHHARASRWVKLEEKFALFYRKPCLRWQVGSSHIASICKWAESQEQ